MMERIDRLQEIRNYYIYGRISMIQSRTLARLLTAVVAAVAALALLAPAASALTEPAPGYGQFAGCPDKAENAETEGCLRSVVTGGHFQMGSKDVPITQPITISGGIKPSGELFYNSKGGISPSKQEVPGGIVGLTGLDWLVKFLDVDALKVYAVTELAGTANLINEPAELPIKVHLINPVLGNNCYVGSNANPINLRLTTGTTSPPPPNEPITGKEPEFFFDGETGILHLDNGVFVDNSFAAPAAKGCVLNLGIIPVNIDALVNLQSGLPSPAGTNETTQDFDLELVERPLVYP
jgi:hypothetical protein